jgi:hypothetical protein
MLPLGFKRLKGFRCARLYIASNYSAAIKKWVEKAVKECGPCVATSTNFDIGLESLN